MAEGGERTEGRLGVQAVRRLTCMLLISKGGSGGGKRGVTSGEGGRQE